MSLLYRFCGKNTSFACAKDEISAHWTSHSWLMLNLVQLSSRFPCPVSKAYWNFILDLLCYNCCLSSLPVADCSSPVAPANTDPVPVTATTYDTTYQYVCITGHEYPDGTTQQDTTCLANTTWSLIATGCQGRKNKRICSYPVGLFWRGSVLASNAWLPLGTFASAILKCIVIHAMLPDALRFWA